MSLITWILLAVCAVIVLSFVLDRSGRSEKVTSNDELENSNLANEAQPTSTGRFRVQQMLSTTRKAAGVTAKMDEQKLSDAKNQSFEEEEELPDPFKE